MTDTYDNTLSYSYTDYLRTEGVGFNFKLGLIYRVTQALRLGGAFHSPTWYGMTDTYDNTLSYSYTDGSGPNTTFAQSPYGAFDYQLRTPWRANGSIGVVVKKNGFLSAEVEWVDYSSSEFDLTSTISTPETVNLERELNNEISRNYRTAMNIKVGGELALDQLRLRAGVNMLGNPNEGDTDYRMAYTGGIGYRMRAFYADLAYRYMQNDGVVTAYSGAPAATTVTTSNSFMLTLGFNF
jgi:long-subunit fatty acid transport protein